MLDFKGRVALITGAGRGIGRQHALFLASRGAAVVVNDFGADLRGETGGDATFAEAVAEEISAAGGAAMAACCDIGEAEAVDRMISEAVGRFGRLDVLIHNASVFSKPTAFSEARSQNFDRIMRVNVTGGWNVATAAWPHFLEQQYGRIIMTGSGAGYFGRRGDHAYSMAKAALMPLTKALATEGMSAGVKSNMVGPIAWTDNAQTQGIPKIMEAVAPPIRVTNLVAVLAHEDCPVNGEMFHCGGGFVSRVFVGETNGVAFAGGDMSPEAVLERMGEVMSTERFHVPAISDHSGAHLSAAIAAVNPAFAAALTETKRTRDKA